MIERDTVVPTGAAIENEFEPAGGHVDIIVDDQDICGRDPVKIGILDDSPTAQVHERGRLDDVDTASLHESTAGRACHFSDE